MNKLIIEKIAKEILSIRTMTVEQLLYNRISKIAMSAAELIFRTNRRSIKYSKGCVATSKRNDPKNGRWTFSVRCNQNWSKGPYDVRFRLLKSKGQETKGILGREIEISCNCNAWKYNGADFNALDKDYSERQYSNGQAPNIKDPKRNYLICKHIAACIPLFRRFIIPEGFKKLKDLKIIPKNKFIVPEKSIQKTKPKKQLEKEIDKNIKPLTKPTRIKPIKIR